MTVPHNLKRNAYLDNLGTDWVGVDANGDVICRAESEAAVRAAAPHAVHVLNAAHLGNTEGLPIAAAALSATDAALAEIRAQSQLAQTSQTDADKHKNPNGKGPVAHTARPPAAKPAKAHEPPVKTVKVPARKVAHPTKHAGK